VTKDGTPVLTAFSRSSVSRWSVAVGAPKSALIAQVNQSVAWLVVGVFVALALGSWLAMRLALDIGASVSGLIAPALALGAGRPIVLPRASMPETAAVGEALVRASDMLAQAQHMAHHDGLTGLCNRVLFEELAKRALASAARDGSSFCLLAIDLDGFKEVNDMHGHAAGDHVLKLAADRITGLVRASDTVARLGGDEFVVLLAGADITEAAVTADKLVAALSTGCQEIDAMVSASIGVAAYPNSGSTLAMLLERADRALYLAKRLGKNRAVLDRAVAADRTTG
jgi:diguanylate cyclase (GGDEF)-like protein